MRIRPRLRQERWQVTCGLVLIYTLVHHVASNGGTGHVPGNSKVTPSIEKVKHLKHFKSKHKINVTNFYTAELSVHVCSLFPFLCVYILHAQEYLQFKCVISLIHTILEISAVKGRGKHEVRRHK